MSQFVFRKQNDQSELPLSIGPRLAKVRIRICTEGYPETGSLYFEGTVRTFVMERLPHPNLVKMLPLLLTEPRFTYHPGSEILLVERV